MNSFSKSNSKIRVGIVDDSSFIRAVLKDTLMRAGFEICGEAEDPFEAREMIKATNPDVITLDVEMPHMNGIDFLDKIMRLRPMPVIMLSSLTQKNAAVTIEALEIGAADAIAKPLTHNGNVDGDAFTNLINNELVPRLRAVAGSKNIQGHVASTPKTQATPGTRRSVKRRLIGIASSTGGVERLRYLAGGLKCNIPPTMIVQHINRHYIPNLVERIATIAPPHIKVKTAAHNEILQANTIYFADNEHHLQVRQEGAVLKAAFLKAPPLGGFIASAEYLFDSMAETVGRKSVGIIISGMGNDGAKGLLKLMNTGAVTLGESEASCLVYGMPKAAAEAGAIQKSLSLNKILETINDEL